MNRMNRPSWGYLGESWSTLISRKLSRQVRLDHCFKKQTLLEYAWLWVIASLCDMAWYSGLQAGWFSLLGSRKLLQVEHNIDMIFWSSKGCSLIRAMCFGINVYMFQSLSNLYSDACTPVELINLFKSVQIRLNAFCSYQWFTTFLSTPRRIIEHWTNPLWILKLLQDLKTPVALRFRPLFLAHSLWSQLGKTGPRDHSDAKCSGRKIQQFRLSEVCIQKLKGQTSQNKLRVQRFPSNL